MRVALFLLPFLTFSGLPRVCAAERAQAAYLRERLLGTVPLGYAVFGYLAVSPDGRGFAYAASRELYGRSSLILNGQRVYDEKFSVLEPLLISPDAKHVIYRAMVSGGKVAIMVDGRAVSEAYARRTSPLFSPDGKRVAYAVEDTGQLFADDRLIFPTRVRAGRAGLQFAFSPDSKKIAYGACFFKKGCSAFVDRSPLGPVDEEPAAIAFSPDGKVLGYLTSKKFYRFSEQREVSTRDLAYPPPSSGALVFSRDGGHVAYCGSIGERQFVVVDHERFDSQFGQVDHPVFAPSGRHVAYSASQFERSSVRNSMQSEEKWFIVMDNKRVSEAFDEVGPPVFSPDGRKIAFAALKGREIWWKVVDVSEAAFDGLPTRHRRPLIHISSATVTFVREDGTVARKLSLSWGKRGQLPAKALPGINPSEFESSGWLAPKLDVYTSWWAQASPGKSFVGLVVDDCLLWRSYHDRFPIASELTLLAADGRELWRKRLDDEPGHVFFNPLVSDQGIVVVGITRKYFKYTSIHAFDAQGQEIFSFPPAAEGQELRREIKDVSPNRLYVALETSQSAVIFLDVAHKAYWETGKTNCRVHKISDGGVAELSCLKPRGIGWDLFKANIRARGWAAQAD